MFRRPGACPAVWRPGLDANISGASSKLLAAFPTIFSMLSRFLELSASFWQNCSQIWSEMQSKTLASHPKTHPASSQRQRTTHQGTAPAPVCAQNPPGLPFETQSISPNSKIPSRNDTYNQRWTQPLLKSNDTHVKPTSTVIVFVTQTNSITIDLSKPVHKIYVLGTRCAASASLSRIAQAI